MNTPEVPLQRISLIASLGGQFNVLGCSFIYTCKYIIDPLRHGRYQPDFFLFINFFMASVKFDNWALRHLNKLVPCHCCPGKIFRSAKSMRNGVAIFWKSCATKCNQKPKFRKKMPKWRRKTIASQFHMDFAFFTIVGPQQGFYWQLRFALLGS